VSQRRVEGREVQAFAGLKRGRAEIYKLFGASEFR